MSRTTAALAGHRAAGSIHRRARSAEFEAALASADVVQLHLTGDLFVLSPRWARTDLVVVLPVVAVDELVAVPAAPAIVDFLDLIAHVFDGRAHDRTRFV